MPRPVHGSRGRTSTDAPVRINNTAACTARTGRDVVWEPRTIRISAVAGCCRAGATLGALQVASPYIIKARGEESIKLGWIDPLTGSLSALAVTETEGAKYTVAAINKKGGVLGRQLELLVEDSANDVGTGVQKARKLIDRDKVDAIFGDVNSGIAYAIMGVTAEKKIFHIVPGGHTDPITGKDCKWNTFRVCNTTAMDAAAITKTLVQKFGKRFFFITPDYAYGHTLQENFVKNLKALGGEYQGDMLPIAQHRVLRHPDQGEGLQAQRAAEQHGRPGADRLHEAVRAVRHGQGHGARRRPVRDGKRQVGAEGSAGRLVGHGVVVGPARRAARRRVRRRRPQGNGKTPTARHWFGYVAHPQPQARRRKGEVAWKASSWSQALEDMELPPEIALQPGTGRCTARATTN